ncbi:hypothetical protein FHR32_008242 [Streptosporangium album]|uniref:DUF47 domain-containing protein n=1 Tax=Streptosporangium album TaxID=47479 RepID=A0A7W7S6L9_9ACTN|nr:DUF47 family protein [Streptosporangium album]MBB4943841.1 hypothetical protein [Streptosporangium album]
MSPGRVRRVLRDLSGRTDRTLAGLVVAQLRAAARGVVLARAAVDGDLRPAEARRRMALVEHEGDADRARLITRLRRSVTSPVDREDLFRLSRSVDDILDALRDFVREVDLYEASPDPLHGPVLAALADGVGRLTAAVELLADRPQAAADAALHAKKGGVRPAYQQAVAVLLTRPEPSLTSLLLLNRLDTAGAHLAAAADALADGVVKRFQ